MGVLEAIITPLNIQIAQHGTGVVVAAGVAACLVLAIVLNVLNQVLLKNPNEPPVVFHLFPIIGSTITYGIDPYKFFFENQAKVRTIQSLQTVERLTEIVWRCLHFHLTWKEDDCVPWYYR